MIIKMYKWTKKAKEQFMAKTPLDKWKFFRKMHILILRLVGVQFMVEDYKINVFTIIPILLEANYYVLLVYTLYHYRNEPFKALIPTPFLGIFVPVSLTILF